MGHEFMEMKNTNAAIQSYRQAIGRYLSSIISPAEPAVSKLLMPKPCTFRK
jgi:hypothetical protein